MKLYTGNCHCGDVSIAVKTKPIPEIEVKQDNCSICSRVSTRQLRGPRPQRSATDEVYRPAASASTPTKTKSPLSAAKTRPTTSLAKSTPAPHSASGAASRALATTMARRRRFATVSVPSLRKRNSMSSACFAYRRLMFACWMMWSGTRLRS